jgi:hypothetical protein
MAIKLHTVVSVVVIPGCYTVFEGNTLAPILGNFTKYEAVFLYVDWIGLV